MIDVQMGFYEERQVIYVQMDFDDRASIDFDQAEIQPAVPAAPAGSVWRACAWIHFDQAASDIRTD